MSQQINSNQIQEQIPSFESAQPSVENFLNAVNLLFNSKDKAIQNAANKYICKFDKFQESWDISLQILSMPNLTDEVYFNTIQVLKNKIRYDFGNYLENKEIILKLIRFLIENIDTFSAKKHYILLNFCHCFAMALVFTGESFGEIMKECVRKLNNDNLSNIMSLLLIFNYLGEAYFDNQIVIDDHNRELFAQKLEIIGKDVIAFINYVIQKYSKETREQMAKTHPELSSHFRILSMNILETFTNWIRFGLSNDILITLKNENNPIIDFVFQIDQNLLEKHSECICELLKLPMENKMKDLGNVFLTKLLPYKQLFYQSIQTLDKEDSAFFIDVFTTLCTFNFEEIYNEKRFDLIQIIVDLIKICPSSKIDMICDFWESFSQFLVTNQIAPSEILSQFKGIFLQMILNLINLLQFDNAIFSELNMKKTKYLKNNDDYTSVKDYRDSIKRLFHDFVREYSFELFYNDILLVEITKTVNDIKKSPSEIKGWARFEALLYTFYCICREMTEMADISFINMLFDTIFDIPNTFSQITRTVTFIIDEMGKSLSKNPTLLIKAFNYLIVGIDNPIVQKYCSISSKSLLSVNKEILSKNKNQLMELYDSKIKSKALSNTQYLSLLEGIVEVICYGDNASEIQVHVVDIMTIWVSYLSEAQVKASGEQVLNEQEIKQIIELVNVLRSIIRAAYEVLNYDCFAIISQICKELWPGLKFFLLKYQTNSELIEKLIQLIKYFMRGMKSDFKPYLEEYINCIIQGYKVTPISSYLYGFEILVTVYCNDKTTQQILDMVFKELISYTFENYIKSPADLDINVDLGQDLFGLLCRIMKLDPLLVFNSVLFDQIISFSIMNIGINQIEMGKSIIIFVSRIIEFSELPSFKEMEPVVLTEYTTMISNKIIKHSDVLIEEILQTFTQVPPGIIVEQLKELVFRCIQFFPRTTFDSFAKSVMNLPPDCLTNKEKETFLQCITQFKEKKMDNALDKLLNRCQSSLMRAANRGNEL